MLRLLNINIEDNGYSLKYSYQYDRKIKKFFSESAYFTTYDTDISTVPESIAVIPFLANMSPISWFANFDIVVNEIDETFYHSLLEIRKELIKYYPQIADSECRVIYNRLVKNDFGKEKSAMLFSGGVDAFATFFRHSNENPDLITIQGADMELSDNRQWESVKKFNREEPALKENHKNYIRSNLREFYTYHVDNLLPSPGWWGKIQHGLALIGVLAPLSFLKGYNNIYIASTRSLFMEFNPWGSMPETDEKIAWGNLKVIHDGFELKRIDKVEIIVSAIKRQKAQTTVRVCYSELKSGLNCSKCEKCVRTILGIILCGGNPNHYGFQADESIYDLIEETLKKGFKTKGTQFFWSEMHQKAKQGKQFFYFKNKEQEIEKLQNLLPGIESKCKQEIKGYSKLKKAKQNFIHKFPTIFAYYLKIRRKNLA